VSAEDGKATVREFEGRKAWFAEPFGGGGAAYVYFRIDDSFKSDGITSASVEVEYFDAVPGQLGVEFDGSDTSAPFNGAYSRTEKIPLAGDKRWKSATFKLEAARFLNSQNGSADFRLTAEAAEFGVCKVTLRRR